ncbi:phosphonate ABC transporter ATP-binding protein [Rhizobium sp. 007]|uniref:phosphonate ABC transporter ATP-binding protein n=1 Tax=Rhizobium sp. 007 TaxID=2785056 RepID=UPI00188F0158|nr:phosphonate ABC transporter ATP-binding protein [Rhizobium sp. 007]QPB24515.1 phosphonate ABC transporter ATP-binding protein [Rhizobium sp. 007]
MMSLLEIRNLCKKFDQTNALDRVDFTLNPGELTVLLGPSGSGKSTLFKSIMGLVTPDSGDILFEGTSLPKLSGAARQQRLRDLGLIFQGGNLVNRLCAIDNVLGGRLAHVPTWRVVTRRYPDADRQKALATLDAVGLLDRAYQRADSLSGGQQQRVAIARVMAQECRLVLADEPVASLDPETAGTVLATLKQATRAQGIGVLCSLHQLNYATDYADRIIAMRHGRLVLDVSRDEFGRHDLSMLYCKAA